MLRRFEQTLVAYKLCTKDDRILLAVSGGVDSMVMLDLFHTAGFNVGVAHCNFQLRGEESEQDEHFVQEVSNHLKIPFYAIRFDTNNYAAEHGLSVQVAARKLRYDWFEELAEKNGYNLLATAHHLNDNLETTLLHLVRGTGISGLKGIPQKINRIIRPLLKFTSEELISYARVRNLQWREDVSNLSDAYDRNFIRLNIIPQLKKLNPALEDGFLKSNERILGAVEIFEMGLHRLKKEFVRKIDGDIRIEKAILTVTNFPQVLVWELIKEYGFNYTQCKDAVLASEATPGKQFIAAGYKLTIDRDCWIISQWAEETGQVKIELKDSNACLGNLKLNIEHQVRGEILNDPWAAHLDAAAIKFPLTWRRWRDGDYFVPLGMNHRKKISDFLIDNKVSRADKERVTVLESDGNVIWVPGHRTDNRYKVTDHTQRIIKFSITPHFD